MKKLMMVMALVCMASLWVAAEDSNRDKSDTRTMTGCLSRGDSAKEFNLVAEDGSTWEVRSSNQNLSKHVGHMVSVTGVVAHATAHNMKEDTKDMAHDTGIKKDTTEHGHLKVTDLQMVSESCSK